VFLTRTGAMFLNRAQNLVDFYDRLGEECRSLDTKALPVISAQLPALVDKGAQAYNKLLDDLRAEKPLLQIRFLRTSFNNLKSSLIHSSIDILLSYHCGSVRDIVTDYTDRGFSALHLCSEPLVIWCGKKHPLTRIKPTGDDLRNVPIMAPVDSAAPMRRAASEFCRSHGFIPRFSMVDTPTQAEFHAAYLQSSVFLYPKSFTESKQLRKFEDMVAVPFADKGLVHAFAVTYPQENEASQQLDEFISKRRTLQQFD